MQAEIRESLSNAHFASSFATLVALAEELELSGANYELDDEVSSELSVFALPYRRTFQPRERGRVGLYAEGVVGYAEAKEEVADAYGGAAPGLETMVRSRWSSLGALVGVGPDLAVTETLHVAPILNFGIAHVASDADYGGPGAAVTATLLDGLAFNWEAWTATVGGALRAAWSKQLDRGSQLELVSRYDVRWTRTLDVDDAAQRFSTRNQMLSLHAELRGDTDLRLFDAPIGYGCTLGYRRLLEGDGLGIEDVAVLGGSLEFLEGRIPRFPGSLSLSAALFVGQDLTGYSVGLGLSL